MKLKNSLPDKFKNSRQLIAYIFWGVFGVAFSYVSFALLLKIGLMYVAANIISNVATKILIFVTNKWLVFKTQTVGIKATLLELAKFIIAKGVSFAADILLLMLLVEALKADPRVSKLILIVVITGVNYFFSTKFVFKK